MIRGLVWDAVSDDVGCSYTGEVTGLDSVVMKLMKIPALMMAEYAEKHKGHRLVVVDKNDRIVVVEG